MTKCERSLCGTLSIERENVGTKKNEQGFLNMTRINWEGGCGGRIELRNDIIVAKNSGALQSRIFDCGMEIDHANVCIVCLDLGSALP